MSQATMTKTIKELLALHRAEVAELRATIIEADSAYNLDGYTSTWEETAGLVRMCHAGRAALDELTRQQKITTAATERQPAIVLTPITRAIHRIAATITALEPPQWNHWLTYLLEVLDGECPTNYDFTGILIQLHNDILARLENESW